MKHILLVALLLTSVFAKAQTIAAFPKKEDRILTGSNRAIEYKVMVTIPDAQKFENYKITIELDEAKTTLSRDSIFMPANRVITIGKQSEDGIKIALRRDPIDDKIIAFKMTANAPDKSDVSGQLGTSVMSVMVKPLNADGLSKSDNVLFYTGTNVDFIDGVKPKELYFKTSYLLNIDLNDKPTKHWFYFNAGKNRFLTRSDSIDRVKFKDLDLSKYHKDSTYIKEGFYKAAYEEVSDNIFFSADYLYELNNSTSKPIFFTTDFYVGYQTIKTTYKNTVLQTHTSAVLNPLDTLNPIATNHTFHQLNYNFGFGFMYKQTTETFDIRASVNFGYDKSFYTSFIRKTVISSPETLTGKSSIYMRWKLDAALLNPLGVNFGFEALLRSGLTPLYNISFTKILSIKQLGTLFGSSSK